MGALQELPVDVLCIILCKLARQDPVSLLRAIFAFKAFDNAAQNDPDIWRTAFLFPSVSSDFYVEELECFEAGVAILGGYRQLRVARAANATVRQKQDPICPGTNGWSEEGEASEKADERIEQKQSPNTFGGSSIVPEGVLQSEFRERALILVRVEGVPVAYKVFSLWEVALAVKADRFILRTLVAISKTLERLLEHRRMAGDTWGGFKQRLVDTGLISLEFFAFKKAPMASSGVSECLKEETNTFERYGTVFREAGSIHYVSPSCRPSIMLLLGSMQRTNMRGSALAKAETCSPSWHFYLDLRRDGWEVSWNLSDLRRFLKI